MQSWIDVNDPSTQRVLTRVPETSHAEMVRIVDRAEDAFHDWSESSVLRKQGVMLKLQSLIRQHHDDIARSIVLEQGKTFPDAKGDVLRGLQVSLLPRARYPLCPSFLLSRSDGKPNSALTRLLCFVAPSQCLQVVDAACAIPNLMMGEKLEVSKDMDTETRRVPLGVGAAICPYVEKAAALLCRYSH